MLARDQRLRRERDIARVYHKGRFGASPNLQVKSLATRGPLSRAAIVVSKKISKRATVRNRIKRRLAGVLRESWQTVKPGYDIVITARADIKEVTPSGLKTELISALRKSGALTDQHER